MNEPFDPYRPQRPPVPLAGDQPHQAPGPDETADESEQPATRGVILPLFLFAATCYSTLAVGGPVFAAALMTILLCHEFGHYIQAVRYGVPATLPLFIPMPFSPIGTMGAVIAMRPHVGDRRAIFDIGITGPLAGLVPSLLFSVLGLQWSQVVAIQEVAHSDGLGTPVLFKVLAHLIFGPLSPGEVIQVHPLAYAGWVGVFITALNLIPIGQLDGGHVLYCLLLRRAHAISQLVLLLAMFAIVLFGYWQWTIMILLLMLMGPIHPPTANDDIPLGAGRTILGWATLLFLPIGFTPTPFLFGEG